MTWTRKKIAAAVLAGFALAGGALAVPGMYHGSTPAGAAHTVAAGPGMYHG